MIYITLVMFPACFSVPHIQTRYMRRRIVSSMSRAQRGYHSSPSDSGSGSVSNQTLLWSPWFYKENGLDAFNCCSISVRKQSATAAAELLIISSSPL